MITRAASWRLFLDKSHTLKKYSIFASRNSKHVQTNRNEFTFVNQYAIFENKIIQ